MVEQRLKHSFRGYNKSDVHAYVAKLDNDMKVKIALYEDRLTETKKEMEELENSYNRSLEGKDLRIEELISAKVSFEKACEESAGNASELSENLAEAQNKLKILEKENAALKEENMGLLSKISVLEAERSSIPSALIAAEEKAKSVINGAQKRADDIISGAVRLSDDKIAAAENEYKKLVAQSEDFKRKVIVSRQNLIAAMQAYKEALDEALEGGKE